ncbi:MAG: hypothetical protein HFE52_02600, partial [Clostridia bacterium]|nr:hypothetical protein [Clostridia bacterium]
MKKSMWKGMLAIVFTLVTICISINAYAALAEPKLQKVYQADGTEITVYSYGDEYFHWVEDEYENVIVYDLQDKNWHYACIENDNIIADTDIVGLENSVCFTNKIKRDDIQYLIEKSIKSNGNNSYNNSSEYSPRINNEQPKTNQELLLLLIEFDNITLMDNKDNGQYWYSQYFSAEKNVAQYYKDMSNGLDIFIPSTTQNIGLSSEITDTVQYQGDDSELNTIFKGEEGVPVTISNAYDGVIKVKFHMEHPIQYRLSGDDTKIEQALVSLALGMIKEKTQYDFAGFGDNKQVSVIVAGGEASASYGRNGQVWSHCGIFDGNVIGLSGECRYILHGELYSPGRELSIGVPCHELGHILGLPDLYNTETDPYGINARNDARNFYSLMGCGNWGAEYGQTGGSTPVSLDAWSKIYLGYIEPIEYDATDYAVASVNSLENVGVGENSSYNVLRLNNVNVDPNQYFLIENRQNSGWDEGMVRFFNGQTSFSGGIVIMQIDEDVIDNYIGENKVNIVNNHRGVDIVGHFGGSSTGHYFYSSDRENMKEFTDSTVPSSKFYDPDDEMTGTQRKSSHINIIIDNNSQAEMSVTLGKDTEITDKIPDNNFLKEIRKA